MGSVPEILGLFANVALDEKGTEARKKAAKSAREREEKAPALGAKDFDS